MTASTRPLLGFPIRNFESDEPLAVADESLHEAYVLIEGRADVYALDGDGSGKLMTSPVRELRDGDIVNPELLTTAGLRGVNSSFTVKAKTKVSAYVISLKDLSDPSVSNDVRDQRIAIIMNAIASSAIDAMSQRVHRIEETALYEKALEPTKDLEKQVAELTELNISLQKANVRTDALMERITKEAVDAVLMQQLRASNQKLRMYQDPERLHSNGVSGFLMYLQEMLIQLYQHPDTELARDAVALSHTIYKVGKTLPREGKFAPPDPTK